MAEPQVDTFNLAVFLAENWLNILFGLVGIAGSIFGYSSWSSSRKSESAYKHLFELADLHIDKSLTDKKLSDSKLQLQEEADRIKELQRTIRHEIPIEARRAVLRDKFETNVEQIHDVYLSLNRARTELTKLGDRTEIPEEIKKAIDDEIKPEYLIKRRKSDLRNYLTIITAFAAISSALLPYPFSRFLSWFLLGFFGLPVTYFLAKLSWKDWKTSFVEKIFPFIKTNLGWIGLGLLVSSIILFMLMSILRDYIYTDYGIREMILFVGVILGAILLIIKTIMVLVSRKTKST